MIQIVYFGTPDFSAHILSELIKSGQASGRWQIRAIVTQPDKLVGRKKILKQSETADVAQQSNIPILKPEKLSQEFTDLHKDLLVCDLFIVASYGKIIPQRLLDLPTLGSINVHPSLLPKYRGASPIQSVLLNGDSDTGISIMIMDAEMDHGPILAFKELGILPKDNYQTLSKKLSHESAILLIETLYKFLDNQVIPLEQDHSQATFTKLLTKNDGFFEIDQPPPAEKLANMIKAFYPWPGVWTRWQGKVVKLYPDHKIQIEGKQAVSMKDFLNGYPDFPLKDLL